jgi:hypothetical protein
MEPQPRDASGGLLEGGLDSLRQFRRFDLSSHFVYGLTVPKSVVIRTPNTLMLNLQ